MPFHSRPPAGAGARPMRRVCHNAPTDERSTHTRRRRPAPPRPCCRCDSARDDGVTTHRLSDFDYELPAELIAQSPTPRRGASRLLDVAPDALHDRVSPTCRCLARGDLLVFNDTRVIKARAVGREAQRRTRRDAGRARPRRARGMGAAPREPPAAGRHDDRTSMTAPRAKVRRARRSILHACASTSTATLVDWLERARRDAAAALHRRAPPTRATRRATRPCTRASRAPSPRRPPACISTTRCWRRSRARGVGARIRHAARGRRHLPAGAHDDLARAPDAHRVVRSAGARPSTPSRARAARRARRRRRHDDAARARSRAAARRGSARGRRRARPRSSSRPATASASSTGCSPTSTCRARRC